MTRPAYRSPPQREWKARGLEQGAGEARPRLRRLTNTGRKDRLPELRVPVLAPRSQSLRAISGAQCARGAPPGKRVGTSLSFHLSSLLPGAHVGGAARGCAWRGPLRRVSCVGWGAGRTLSPSRTPAAAAERSRAPLSVPPRRGSTTYPAEDTEETGRPRPPRHSLEAPGVSPSRS
jgi:hypothetical protein